MPRPKFEFEFYCEHGKQSLPKRPSGAFLSMMRQGGIFDLGARQIYEYTTSGARVRLPFEHAGAILVWPSYP